MAAQVISFDKLNQLRHVLYFKNAAGVLAHMKKHAAILKPKFDIVNRCLEEELAPLGIASWHKPTGGYFVSLLFSKAVQSAYMNFAEMQALL